MSLEELIKFAVDDNFSYLVIEACNGNFYGFNLSNKNERVKAECIVRLHLYSTEILRYIMFILFPDKFRNFNFAFIQQIFFFFSCTVYVRSEFVRRFK